MFQMCKACIDGSKIITPTGMQKGVGGAKGVHACCCLQQKVGLNPGAVNCGDKALFIFVKRHPVYFPGVKVN